MMKKILKCKNRINKLRWEFAKKLKGTQHIIARITTRCNLDCPFCSIRHICKVPLDLQERDINFWIEELSKYDIISISGGEPALFNGVHRIINALINKKKLVRVVTNLVDIREYRKVIPSWRVYFAITYHHDVLTEKQRIRFGENYEDMLKKYTTCLKEMRYRGDNTQAYLKDSKIYWIKETEEELPMPGYFPDGSFVEGDEC